MLQRAIGMEHAECAHVTQEFVQYEERTSNGGICNIVIYLLKLSRLMIAATPGITASQILYMLYGRDRRKKGEGKTK